jgi:hypothetical protein
MKKTALKISSYLLSFALIVLFLTNCKKENDSTTATEDTIESTTVLKREHRCAAHTHDLNCLHDHPEVKETRREIEAFTAKFVSEYGTKAQTRSVVTIPVVIHVLYKTTAQNISDAQIQSQLKVLNDDFRKLNADAANVPTPFKPLAADIEINFVLAQQDPNGNATNGVVRKTTTQTSFADDGTIYSSSTGGSNIWDSKRYLNIYVCNMAEPLGFATYPGGPANEDAAVIHFEAFGTMGTAQAPYNLGRTVTHEVGHWLNLIHIWGDDYDNTLPINNQNTCSGSDEVADTPNQSIMNYGAPAFPHITCGNTPNGDMFMNYMDYVADADMYMFTAGQKARMKALFATGGARYGITTSNGANPPSVNTCGVPSTLTASNVTASAATLNWAAVSGATSYTVQYKTSAAASWTTAPNTTTNTLIINNLTASTAYQFQVKTTCSSGTSAFSAAANFTTQANVSTGCTDNYESNNSSSTSKTIPINTEITAKIGTASDIDWFTFTTTSAQTKFRIDLTNLPFDYDLELYKNGVLLAYSQNDATLAELITQNATTAATYKIKVYPYSGFSNTNCYTLKVQASSSNFKAGKTEKNNKNGKNIEVNSL